MNLENEPGMQNLFPRDHCERVMAELSMWTRVQDVMAAARFLENRKAREDVFTNKLAIPFPDSDLFKEVLFQCVAWLTPAFRVPESKISVVALKDRQIKETILQAFRDLRWQAKLSDAGEGTFEMGEFALHRYVLVESEPHIIELIQNPLRCLMDLINRFWATAGKVKTQLDETADGSQASVFFHQPYTDGSMAALVEALVFFAHKIELGPRYNQPGEVAVNRGYRSVELIASPPIDATEFAVAQTAMEEEFRSLA